MAVSCRWFYANCCPPDDDPGQVSALNTIQALGAEAGWDPVLVNQTRSGSIGTMYQVENVLAALGQFPQDDPVLARAAEIARAHQAKLTIVHVIGSISDLSPAPVNPALIEHQVQLIARERVEAAVVKLKASVPELEIRIEIGLPHVRLIEVARDLDADLVVIRAHQGDSILEKIIGSTTDRVIRTSGAPVLVVKRPVKHAYQRVVVGIDTSDNSATIVPFVAGLFALTELSLIHVVQIPLQFEAAMLLSGSGQNLADYRAALIDKAEVNLRDISNKLTDRPIPTATRTAVGHPATLLVRATWNPKVDMIALGPGNAGTMRRTLLGSVARRVLRTATCDVLICPPASQDTDEHPGRSA